MSEDHRLLWINGETAYRPHRRMLVAFSDHPLMIAFPSVLRIQGSCSEVQAHRQTSDQRIDQENTRTRPISRGASRSALDQHAHSPENGDNRIRNRVAKTHIKAESADDLVEAILGTQRQQSWYSYLIHIREFNVFLRSNPGGEKLCGLVLRAKRTSIS